jgi:hypothetical protein
MEKKKAVITFSSGISDEFTLSTTEIAYDNKDNIYSVFISENNHISDFATYGKLTAIVNEEDKVVEIVLPLLSCKNYIIIEKKELKRYSKLYEKSKKLKWKRKK